MWTNSNLGIIQIQSDKTQRKWDQCRQMQTLSCLFKQIWSIYGNDQHAISASSFVEDKNSNVLDFQYTNYAGWADTPPSPRDLPRSVCERASSDDS